MNNQICIYIHIFIDRNLITSINISFCVSNNSVELLLIICYFSHKQSKFLLKKYKIIRFVVSWWTGFQHCFRGIWKRSQWITNDYHESVVRSEKTERSIEEREEFTFPWARYFQWFFVFLISLFIRNFIVRCTIYIYIGTHYASKHAWIYPHHNYDSLADLTKKKT